MAIDFGKTAADYAKHRVGFPDRFFDRLFSDRIVAKGDRVLDLGTGTGTIARGSQSAAVSSPDSIPLSLFSNRPRPSAVMPA